MKIYKDISLSSFEFWEGALDRAKLLTDNELERIEAELNAEYPDGMNDTELNDLFWFDFDFVCRLIGTTEQIVFAREED